MAEVTHVLFGPFRLDFSDRRLWKGLQAVELTPQAFTLLAYLVQHPGRLVTKDELMQAVWQNTVISDDGLYALMSEVRRALRDDPHEPQFIKTESKQGYRFIGAVDSGQSSLVSPPLTTLLRSQVPSDTWQLPPGFVGRGTELAQLHKW